MAFRKYSTAFFLVIALHLASAGVVIFEDCGSTATNIQLQVTDCSGVTCVVKKGSDIDVVIDFTPSRDTSYIESRAYGYISGAPIPYDQVPQDGCLGILTQCPLEDSDGVQYRISLHILNEYPTQKLTAKWELTDDRGDNAVCLQVPVEIEP